MAPQPSPCELEDAQPAQTQLPNTIPQCLPPACLLSACANCLTRATHCSWRQRWHFMLACKAPWSPLVLEERRFEKHFYLANAPLQMHFDYSCREEQDRPEDSCGLRCLFWFINWGYAKDLKSPKEINLQIYLTSPQLPNVSHSLSNCP